MNQYTRIGDIALAATAKVRSSAVAPLVAQARGYRAVDSMNKVDFQSFVHDTYGANAQSMRHKLAKNVNAGDFLYVPNFDMQSVNERTTLDPRNKPTGVRRQYRPSNPTGKRKYIFDEGTSTCLDAHPSTPSEYFRNPATVLITEGVLKGDSVLSAYLAHHGHVDLSERLDAGDNPDKALHDALLDVPADERLLVLSIAGVQNWHHNNEWTTLSLRDSHVWIAFDGDLDTNRNVWDATAKMMTFLSERKKVTDDRLFLLDLSQVPVAPGESKVGIDDFLSDYGHFTDLPGMLTHDLPPAPPKPVDAFVGQWQMNDEGTVLRECVPGDENSDARWVDRVGIGGRIVRVTDFRAATEAEKNSWVLGDGVSPEDTKSEIEIEVSWYEGSEDGKEVTDQIVRRRITGPASLLSTTPADWDRNGAIIPSDVRLHVDWPPRKYADQWMRALKMHRSDEKDVSKRWTTMGWVPSDVPNSPVFIVGNEVYDERGLSDKALPGVGDNQLAGASQFGVVNTDDPNVVKRAIETIVDRFLIESPWKAQPKLGSLMLTAALRPTIPRRPMVPIYLVGQAATGKALPLSAEIPVEPSARFPHGVAVVGDIQVGDRVIGSAGTPTRVRGLNDIHTADVYDIECDDGRVFTVSGEHMLKVSSTSSRFEAFMSSPSAMRSSFSTALEVMARTHGSGQSGTVSSIATAFGIRPELVEAAIIAARVPSMDALAPAGESRIEDAYSSAELAPASDRPIAVVSPTVTEDELGYVFAPSEVSAMTGGAEPRQVHRVPLRATTVYPVGEVLAAVADILVSSDDGSSARWFSATVAELASRTGEGLRIPPITPRSLHEAGSSPMFAAGRACARRALAGEVALVEAMSSRERIEYAHGYLSALPDGVAVSISDAGTRDDAVTLLRSIGLTPLASRDGYLIVEKKHSTVSIVRITKREAPELVRCITVDAFDGMFAGPGHVLTHNSWTAATAMLFWEKNNTWNADNLPGSAGDTLAATEQAVHMAPLWVVDDLAPSPERGKAQADQERIATLIRRIYNGTGKRRSTVDMEQRRYLKPYSPLIATAENEIPIASAMSRTFCVNLRRGGLDREGMDRMLALQRTDEAAIVTCALVKFIAGKKNFDELDRSRNVSELWEEAWRDYLEFSSARMSNGRGNSSDVERQAKLVADLMLVIEPLHALAISVGVDEKYLRYLSVTGAEDTIGSSLLMLSMEAQAASTTSSPGVNLIKALKWSLSGCRDVHIANSVDPTNPPVSGGQADGLDSRRINSLLGWSYSGGDPRQNGVKIGALVEKDGHQVVVFDQHTAFDQAQRLYPSLLPPGSSAKTAWAAVWDSGLGAEGSEYGLPHRQATSPKSQVKRSTMTIMVGGQRITGVPVPLDVLLGIDDVPDAETEGDEDVDEQNTDSEA